MKRFSFGCLLLLAAVGIDPGAAVSAQEPAAGATLTLQGRWTGTLDRNPDRPVIVELRTDAQGHTVGSVTGVASSSSSYVIDAVEQTGTAVRLVVGEAGGGIEGVLSEDGNAIEGLWFELAITTPLQLRRVSVLSDR